MTIAAAELARLLGGAKDEFRRQDLERVAKRALIVMISTMTWPDGRVTVEEGALRDLSLALKRLGPIEL